LVVVCCVLCVVVVVVTSPFSYLIVLVEMQDRASQNGDLSALIAKDASPDAPNVRGCPQLSLSLVDFGHVLTFGLRRDIGGLCMSAEKGCSFLPR
jgi:hypothetical protein